MNNIFEKMKDDTDLYRILQECYIQYCADANGYIWCCDCVVENCEFRQLEKPMEYCHFYTKEGI